MRDRLIELLGKSGASFERALPEEIADYLLENGVIVPPCKVGDIVYVVSRYYQAEWAIHECKVCDFTVFERNVFMSVHGEGTVYFGLNIIEIGKTVFLTKEEAEAALKEREQG